MKRILASAVLPVAFCLTLFAEPAPTTRPAKVDLSTSDSAFDSLIDAVEQGDLDAYAKVVLRQTPDERRVAQAEVTVNLAALRLTDATRRKLGAEAAQRVQEMMGQVGFGPAKDGGSNLREARRESAWKMEANGNEAVLGEVIPEIRFRRIEGQWRMLRPVEESGEELDRDLKIAGQLGELIDQVTRKVNEGALADADQIGRALNFLWPVATTEPSPEPTTQPATRPH